MTERVRTRMREAEPPMTTYDRILNLYKQQRETNALGAVVVRNKDVKWEMARQGKLKFLFHPFMWDKVASPGWLVFQHDIRRHSGKHVHQGGLVIFVLEGKGHTIVDGVRYDWEAGDLIILPVKAGGCEHQHFNAVEGEPCKWVAFVYNPYENIMGDELTQREASPDWKPS